MRKIVQNLKNGKTELIDMPVPFSSLSPQQVLIKTTHSLVSLGTERMLVDFAKSNLINKARKQPEKVKMVLDKISTDGLMPTIKSVRNKFDEPMSLGYCNVGIVEAVGSQVTDLLPGDRVASNGSHAEYVVVPKNLVQKIPADVTSEEAAFTVIGSIGLQGIRLLNPTFGETIVVVGLGLIGLVTAELLKANGCNVIGFDYDPVKIELAKKKGIKAINPAVGTDQVKFVENYTNEIGADGVIITASNSSNEIISQSARMCRKRGRVILIGVVGLDIIRDDFYEKEITFQVSCSYGAGRYDENYEQKGQDYPIGYVRWTEKRNFEAILNAISKKNIDVRPLITDLIPFDNYLSIYGNMNNSKSIASILVYDQKATIEETVSVVNKTFEGQKGILGIIGSGNFTSSTMLPNLKKANADISYIASAGGLSSTTLAKKYSISNSTTDYKKILSDKDVDLVFITTKHDSHAKFVLEVMEAGKSVFVEKPLTIKEMDLDNIVSKYEKLKVNVTVGFNRRFAPLAQKMKSVLGSSETPINIIATMNAGAIPADVWIHDMEIGGGRILGEACHYIDLCTYLSGSKVISVCMNSMGVNPQENTDNASILLKYENGSNAVINYFANGSKSYSKERIEVFSQERTLIMDNWRRLNAYGFKGFSKAKSGQDKGHFNQFEALVQQQKNGGEAIIPFDEIVNTTRASFAAIKSLKEKKWIDVK